MKRHKIRASAAFLIWLTICQLTSGQELTKLNDAMQQFKQRHPEVSDLTLEKDTSAVVAAAPIVQYRLKGSGFSNSEIEEALIASWRTLRTHRAQTEGIDKSDVVNEAVQQGRLIVDSEPEGAAVMIDGVQYPETKTSQWLPAGLYHIILKKDGYVPVDDDQEVDAGKTVTFTRSLIPGRPTDPVAEAGERPERSAWDGITGGGRTKEAIKSVVSDPDSVQLESSTSPWVGQGRGGACWIFKVAFRYRNGFGGYTKSVAMVYWRNEKVIDCVIDF